MEITLLELKFLLRLLAYNSYRTDISKIQLNPQTKTIEREKICASLCSKGLIGYSNEVKQFGITLAGRTLLGLDTSTLPATPDEIWVLRACLKGLATPEKISAKVPAESRQRLIRALESRGLIKVHSQQIKEVWLTEKGQHFLRTDYQPEGIAPVLSLSLLGNYLQFLRQP
ncbi:MAG TPA: hypothetical protein V6D29_25245 [Leptolyngbyaceae cyanobacterium]